MEKEKILETLKRQYPNSLWKESQRLSLDDWKTAGKPYIWEIVQIYKGYYLLSDQGYGKLALYKDGAVISTSNSGIVNDSNMIGLGEYYGFEKPTLFEKVD